ncbi:hypothetical protein H072_1832 [Dactylellina haptotyla CBS 200.50]|uniref:Uncharacterized protein n=1 Tax=Dactylellina haptotyla (strain CBS 200.50) TaxID=1284197 RepID=S8AMP9_DACHA|nr:hypothetical protein H072_1832 [Dactylellina haptotyla CBS 200.50]
MEDPQSSPNASLLGKILKSQQPGQDFASAAATTLKQIFPDIPPDTLTSRVQNLEKAMDSWSVSKYRDLITFQPKSKTGSATSETSRASTSSDNTISVVSKKRTSWSPSHPAPEQYNQNINLYLPDLDGIIITDTSESSDASSEVILLQEKQNLATGSPLSPTTKHSITKKRKAYPQTRIKQATSSNNTPPKTPSTVAPSSTNYISEFAAADKCISVPCSAENSPIKSLLNNRTARLRTKSNLKKISQFEEPKPHINFGPIALPKSTPSVHSTSEEDDAAAAFAFIDDYFQNPKTHIDVQRKNDIVKGNRLGKIYETKGSCENKNINSVATKTNTKGASGFGTPTSANKLNKSTGTIEKSFCYHVNKTSLRDISADGCMQLGDRPSKVLTPQIRKPSPSTSSQINLDMQSDAMILKGVVQNPHPTKVEVARGKEDFDPTTLTLQIGTGGLVVNIYCDNDPVFTEKENSG